MRDTLRYVWLFCMDRLDEARQAGGGDLAMTHTGAAIAMRLRDYLDAAGAAQRFLELKVEGPEERFLLTGRFSTEPGLFDAPDGLDWRLDGAHDALCEWLLPWVALHIEHGGGYIDFDG